MPSEVQVTQAKSKYPELAVLPDKIITDLVAQNFKCCVTGESVLEERQEYWIVKYSEEIANKMGREYSCLLPDNWDPQHEGDLEILQKLQPSS